MKKILSLLILITTNITMQQIDAFIVKNATNPGPYYYAEPMGIPLDGGIAGFPLIAQTMKE